MIVRIAGEDQFRLDESHEARLQELDEAVLKALESGDEAAFRGSLAELLDFVRASGAPLGADELEASDVILPPSDTTLDEAAERLQRRGLAAGVELGSRARHPPPTQRPLRLRSGFPRAGTSARVRARSAVRGPSGP